MPSRLNQRRQQQQPSPLQQPLHQQQQQPSPLQQPLQQQQQQQQDGIY